MAYSRRYFLLRVKEVNEMYLAHSRRGLSNEYIYLHHIVPQFHISRSTFYDYLTIPYASLLRQLDEQEGCQAQALPELPFPDSV